MTSQDPWWAGPSGKKSFSSQLEPRDPRFLGSAGWQRYGAQTMSAPRPRDPRGHVAGKFIQPLAMCANRKRMVHLFACLHDDAGGRSRGIQPPRFGIDNLAMRNACGSPRVINVAHNIHQPAHGNGTGDIYLEFKCGVKAAFGNRGHHSAGHCTIQDGSIPPPMDTAHGI